MLFDLLGVWAQVNIAGRAAAISPANADTLAAFAGVYASHQLPEVAGKPAEAGFELSITVNSQGAPLLPAGVRPVSKTTCGGRARQSLSPTRIGKAPRRPLGKRRARTCMCMCTAGGRHSNVACYGRARSACRRLAQARLRALRARRPPGADGGRARADGLDV